MKLLVAMLMLVSVAYADDRELARKLYREGAQHYKLGEFNEALASFKEAYRKFEDPTLLFNIAQSQRQLNLKADAVRTYKAYLNDVPGAPNREEVMRTVAALEEALRKDREATQVPPQGTLPAPETTGPATATPAPATSQPSPATTTAAPAAATTTSATVETKKTPVYKKWWLWTIVGVVVVGAAVGLGVGLAPGPSAPSVMTTNGTFRPF
jgi:tetratricopeptide (TPR) repeat protein